MIRIKEMLKNLIGTFIQWIEMMIGGQEEEEVYYLANFTPSPIEIPIGRGKFILLPSEREVCVKKKDPEVGKVLRRESRLYPIQDLEIDGLDELRLMPKKKIAIVTNDVFDAIRKNRKLCRALKGRVASFEFYTSRMKGDVLVKVVQLQDLFVL